MPILELPNQVAQFSAKSFWNLDLFRGGIFHVYLILAQRVVFERLNRLFLVYIASKDIVQTKLSRKNVHHHVQGILVRPGSNLVGNYSISRLGIMRKAVKYIYIIRNCRYAERSSLRICRKPNRTPPCLFAAARAYIILFRTKVMLAGVRTTSRCCLDRTPVLGLMFR